MIYLLEDDSSIRELLVYTLNSQGLDAEGFGLPSQFWSAMEHAHPNLILLDITALPCSGICAAPHGLRRFRLSC